MRTSMGTTRKPNEAQYRLLHTIMCGSPVQFGKGDGEACVPVVHNYGHGGAGITLSWGCALDTLELVKQALG